MNETGILLVARNGDTAARLKRTLGGQNLPVMTASTYWIGPSLRHMKPSLVLVEPSDWQLPPRSILMAVTVLVQALSEARVALFSRLPADEQESLCAEFSIPVFVPQELPTQMSEAN